MADNVEITQGAGTPIATDEVTIGASTVHVQRVKLVDGTEGGADGLPGSATKGLQVDARGTSTLVQQSVAGLTTATTSYAVGDQLGTGLEFANVVRDSGGTARIDSAFMLDKSAIVYGADLYLFSQSVTPAADNAAWAFSDAHMMFCQGVIEFRAPRFSANNGFSVGLGLPIIVEPAATSLFGYLVTQAAHTFFGSATDLVVTLGISQD